MKDLLPFILLATTISGAYADTVVGKIHTVHSNIETRRAHIQMEGSPVPTFNGGSACTGVPWTGNSMDDNDFRQFVLPILLTAKTTGETISITVNGCVGAFPRITGVDYSPRLE